MKTNAPFQSRLIRKTAFCFVISYIVFLILCTGSHCLVKPLEADSAENSQPEKNSEYVKIRNYVDSALKAEKENTAKLEKLKLSAKEVSDRINTYNIQLSSHNNLVASPDTRIEDIEKAWADTQIAVADIPEILETLTNDRSEIETSLKQTEEQLALNEKHIEQLIMNEKHMLEVNTDVTNVAEVQELVDNVEVLIKYCTLTINSFEEFGVIYTEQITHLEENKKGFEKLLEKFEQQTKSKKKEALFERKKDPLLLLDLKQLGEELKMFVNQIHGMFSKDFWLVTCRSIWKTGGFMLISSLLLFVLIILLLFRLRYRCLILVEKYPLSKFPWHHLLLQLFHRSLFLLGIAVFLYVYALVQDLYSTISFIRVVVHILLIFLFTRWILDFLRLWNQREKNRIPLPLLFRIRILMMLIRSFALVYVIVAWLLGSDSITLLFGRVFFEIALLLWGILFWRSFQKSDPDAWKIVRKFSVFRKSDAEQPPSLKLSGGWLILKATVITMGDIIVGGGILMEIFGYGSLAIYWFASWGCTTVVCLWGLLFFLLLREGNKKLKESSSNFPDKSSKPGDPIRWLFLNLSWLIWAGSLLISLLFAWGAKQTVIVSLFEFLTSEFTLGGTKLSFINFIYALLVLLVAHAGIRLWQNTLIKKLLVGSGLRTGLRDSITLITVYVFWFMGILISLSVLGFSTKSFALAFGGLGIGLGFGLQNIFNNFISGLILLFERPIEVGDAIEINGVWGEVKKINVRSTLVQTYDYADLIIPNSDFISNMVTNWTYKDQRIRRKLRITVAYGSDTELVRQTLLEIAENEKEVLKYPKSYVLFTDFGDSALHFQLRFWAHVDNFNTIETHMRFEIDRLFREKNIEIPFPQQDVHLQREKWEMGNEK